MENPENSAAWEAFEPSSSPQPSTGDHRSKIKSYQNKFSYLKEPRKRTRTTPEQLQILLDFFEKTPNPNIKQRKVLSEKTNMTPRAVQIWFQNRRAKIRNQAVSSNLQLSPSDQSSSNAPSPNPNSNSNSNLLESSDANSSPIINQNSNLPAIQSSTSSSPANLSQPVSHIATPPMNQFFAPNFAGPNCSFHLYQDEQSFQPDFFGGMVAIPLSQALLSRPGNFANFPHSQCYSSDSQSDFPEFESFEEFDEPNYEKSRIILPHLGYGSYSYSNGTIPAL